MPWDVPAVAPLKSKHRVLPHIPGQWNILAPREQLQDSGQKADDNRQLRGRKDFWKHVFNMNLSDDIMFHLGCRNDIELQLA